MAPIWRFERNARLGERAIGAPGTSEPCNFNIYRGWGGSGRSGRPSFANGEATVAADDPLRAAMALKKAADIGKSLWLGRACSELPSAERSGFLPWSSPRGYFGARRGKQEPGRNQRRRPGMSSGVTKSPLDLPPYLTGLERLMRSERPTLEGSALNGELEVVATTAKDGLLWLDSAANNAGYFSTEPCPGNCHLGGLYDSPRDWFRPERRMLGGAGLQPEAPAANGTIRASPGWCSRASPLLLYFPPQSISLDLSRKGDGLSQLWPDILSGQIIEEQYLDNETLSTFLNCSPDHQGLLKPEHCVSIFDHNSYQLFLSGTPCAAGHPPLAAAALFPIPCPA